MANNLLGYSVGWKDTDSTKFAGEYIEATAGYSCGMQVFTERSDAEIVLAAEKLKTPTMEWMIFEVHDAK